MPPHRKAVDVARNHRIMILGTWKMIEIEVLQKFSFLQNQYDYPPFKTKIWKDEYYINSRKANIEFSVYIQMESDACPSISIINHSEEVEFDNSITLTNSYDIEKLEANNTIISSMPKAGNESVKQYIAECANILKRHPEVLLGNVSQFEKKMPFTELKIQIYRTNKDGYVIKDGIRTIKSLSEFNNIKARNENHLTRLLARLKKYFT